MDFPNDAGVIRQPAHDLEIHFVILREISQLVEQFAEIILWKRQHLIHLRRHSGEFLARLLDRLPFQLIDRLKHHGLLVFRDA